MQRWLSVLQRLLTPKSHMIFSLLTSLTGSGNAMVYPAQETLKHLIQKRKLELGKDGTELDWILKKQISIFLL